MTKAYPVTAEHYSKGLNQTAGPENLPPEALTEATNARYNEKGSAFMRLGFELKGDVASDAKIDSIFTHETYNVMFTKSGTKIYQSVDGITWYDIGVTRTASAREFFYSVGKDVHATNGIDSYLRIAVSTMVDALVAATTTSALVRTGDGDSFANGTIYVDGDAITETISTDTLTITAASIAANHAAGAIVTQTSTPSGAPKATWICDLEGSTVAGGTLANPENVYYTGPATEADPQFAYDFSANGAGSKRMNVPILAAGKVTGGIILGGKRGIFYADQFQVDTGALITRELHKTHGVTNAFAFIQGDRRTYVLTNTGRYLPIISDADGVRVVDYVGDDKRNLDYPIRSFLTSLDEDQSLSFNHYDPVKALASACVFKDGVSYELVLNEDLGAWAIDKGKTFSCKTNFKNRVYAGSDNTDEIFLDEEGVTDNGIPILFRLKTPVYTVDNKRISSEFLMWHFSGRLSGAGQFIFRLFVDGNQVDAQTVTADQLVEKGLMIRANGTPLGATSMSSTLGSSGNLPTVYAFSLPYEILLNGRTFQAEWEVFDEGTSLEIRDSRLDAESEGENELPSF